MTISISARFDGGNIELIEKPVGSHVRLKIRKDAHSEFLQWFYFRSTGTNAKKTSYSIENAGQTSYADGWKDYKVCASYDLKNWFRVSDTSYTEGKLNFSFTAEHESVYFAYFAPYTMVRHQNLIAGTLTNSRVQYKNLGQTLDGQDMDLLVIANSFDPDAIKEKKKCWVIARQHPGETMAEWFMEGWLERVLDATDPVTRTLLENVVFYVVPNMNPDGSRRGHLRTNAAGSNLNREWQNPTMEKSPEVYLVLKEMEKTGVDCCLDVHGDEALPYNFIAGAEGVPGWSQRLLSLQEAYKSSLVQNNPDFQTKYGYDVDTPGAANLAICTNYIAEAFDCLSMTLEMPFKDNADAPCSRHGWSPERAQKLGASNLDALYAVVDKLR